MAACDDDPDLLDEVLGVAAVETQGPLLLVDMSRGDGVRRAAARHGNRIRYEAFADSAGLSDSRNRILELCPSRYLVFIDADAVPQRGWAGALRAAFDAEPAVAAVGARCLPRFERRPPRLLRTATAGDFFSLLDLGGEARTTPRVVGTSFALDLTRVGGLRFPLDLGLRPGHRLGGEEVWLCEQLRRAGWTIRYEPAAVVHHHVPATRASWPWMLRRAFTAGREAGLWDGRLDPLPRRLTLTDRLFQAAIAPAFVAGRLRMADSATAPQAHRHHDDAPRPPAT